jgi:DNA-binding GntR family transcriptional regulator
MARNVKKKTTDLATLADQAYAAIEEMIVDRTLEPGQMISEAEMGSKLGLGRTPIREAIARLKSVGFVEIHSRRGVQVSIIDPIKHLELLEVRLPLELDVVKLAVKRATDMDLQDLATTTKSLVAAAKKGDRRAYFHVKRQLHDVEVRSARNSILSITMRTLHAQSRRFWQSYEPTDSFAKGASLHESIAKSIIARNEAAARNNVEKLFAFLESLTELVVRRRHLDERAFAPRSPNASARLRAYDR